MVAHPIEGKVLQDGTWTEIPRSAAIEEVSQRDIRRMFKMLREV